MKTILRAVLIPLLLGSSLGLAQLSVEQRIIDFQTLASLYAKRYAPYEWKKQVFGFDLLDLKNWMDRVRNAKDDLEYLEICHEYVASLDDLHSTFRSPSGFVAYLNFSVDIYDGKVLVESIDRNKLPANTYPFQPGDELVSVDGKTSEQWLAYFERLRRRGNPLTTRRGNADLITYRPQNTVPRAGELGDDATVVIRRAGGDEETYTIPWTKTGLPLTRLGPVPSPWLAKTAQRSQEAEGAPDYMKPLLDLRNWKLADDDHLLQGATFGEDGEEVPRRWLLGYGQRFPAFAFGLPRDFTLRPGIYHFSGTYQSGGVRIGYLRFPSFSPSNTTAALQELEREIAYLEQNTDGLVIDVMRNPGGGCYMLDAAAHLIPNNFYFFTETLRVTWSQLQSMQATLEYTQRIGAEQWIIDVYALYVRMLKEAYEQNRGMTEPIPACTQWTQTYAPVSVNIPASIVYTKPMIVLIDEFSTSAGDIFPAMIQDNRRAIMVGMRTNGGGGSTSTWPTFYSEALPSNTNSLVIRNHEVVTPDYPTAPFVENIGVRPDIELNIMTRENLMNGGATFVQAFTAIMVDQIKAAAPK